MPPELTKSSIEELARLVEKELGLHFPASRHSDLIRGVEQAARELGFENLGSFVQGMRSGSPTRNQLEILSAHLTVGETYFFREKKVFDFLQFDLLPQYVRAIREGKPSLRFWSAACCSGEEAYSVAMLLDSRLPRDEEWHVSILATDINPHFLKKAGEGIYSEWSFRALPDSYREEYFTEIAENRFRIAPHIREMVDFQAFNLAADDYTRLTLESGRMDMIFCRNVMIYFQPELCRRIVSSLHSSLVTDGWLVVSPCEIPLVSASLFETLPNGETSLFRKLTRNPEDEAPPYSRSRNDFALITGAQSETCAPIAPPQRMTELEPSQGSEQDLDPLLVAEALFERGLFAQAADCLEASCANGLADTESSRGDQRELMLLVRAHANLGRFREALDWCDKATASGNTNPDFHYLHASILLEVGREDEAAQALRRVLYLDFDHVLAHFSLGNLRRRQGKLGEATRLYRNALESLRAHRSDEVIGAFDGMTAGALSAAIEELVT